MIEWAGFLYGVIKDFHKYLKYQKGEKIIERKYADNLMEKHLKNGDDIQLAFCRRAKAETIKQEGKGDYYYEVDKENRQINILKLENDEVLIAKPKKISK